MQKIRFIILAEKWKNTLTTEKSISNYDNLNQQELPWRYTLSGNMSDNMRVVKHLLRFPILVIHLPCREPQARSMLSRYHLSNDHQPTLWPTSPQLWGLLPAFMTWTYFWLTWMPPFRHHWDDIEKCSQVLMEYRIWEMYAWITEMSQMNWFMWKTCNPNWWHVYE